MMTHPVRLRLSRAHRIRIWLFGWMHKHRIDQLEHNLYYLRAEIEGMPSSIYIALVVGRIHELETELSALKARWAP